MVSRVLKVYFYSLFFCSVQLGQLVWACPPEGCDAGAGGWQRMNVSCGFNTDTREKAVTCFKKQKWIVASRDEIDKQLEEGYIAIGEMVIHSKASQYANQKVFVFRQHAIDRMGNMYLLSQLG